jgi:hypothetical protein
VAGSASRSKFELVDLSTPEPRHCEGSANISSPIIDLVTPAPILVVDLSTPEPDQLVAPVVDLSTSEPEQLVAALSVSAWASNVPMSSLRAPATDSRPPSILTRSATPSKAESHHSWDGISLHHASQTPIPSEMVLCREALLLKVAMASFAWFLGLEVKSLYFWLYRHALKPDETVSDVCYIHRPFCPVFAIHSLYNSAWKKVTLSKSKVDEKFNIHYLRR